ncbi:sigma-54-dependent Fis family transcriptional regulator [bacterium]|nr:sigma-54-dependent Fis family transcriptional regulator [bacterium]
MEYQALRFDDSDHPVSCTIRAENAEDIVEIRKTRLPAIYLLSDDAIDAFTVHPTLIRDRGTKHRKKALSDLLLGYDRTCLIRGSYEGTRQLVRSCKAFLARARDQGDRNAFLIFIPADAFIRLWTRYSGVGTAGRKSRSGRGTAAPSDLPGLLGDEEVPPQLRESYIGDSPDVNLVRRLILIAARCENPTLILGESGTGKEIVARSIHQLSARRGLRFEAVNCGALPSNLLESTLFGHKKGAFTDARRDRKGSWELASNGTLFLDEIGDLSLENQVKILRALSTNRIRPLGAETDVTVHASVIAATNRDLFAMVQSGHFRDDLYYRLRSFLIFTPALRNHPDDIPLMANQFWRRITKVNAAVLPAAVLAEMKAYPWYGNGRELKNVLSFLNGLFGRHPLGVEHFRAVTRYQRGVGGSGAGERGPAGLALHRAEALQHLKRADEVLRAVEMAVQPYLKRTRTALPEMKVTLSRIENRMLELEALCLYPVLFVNPALFERVRDLHEDLSGFARHLEKSAGGVKGYWLRHLEDPFQRTRRMVFQEVAKIMRFRK